MSDAIQLMQAIMGPGTAAAEAEHALQRALEAEADPLHWCALHFALDQAEVTRRAALWANLVFFESVPGSAKTELSPSRLENLAGMRVLRLPVLDREVVFATPDFFGMIRLGRAAAADPAMRDRLCIVPPSALRGLVVKAAGEALIDGARQNLARSWPYAAAQLDLGIGVRWTFAISIAALTLLVLLAPLSGQLWLMPVWLSFILLPTALRLGALALPHRSGPSRRRVAYKDLPVYSVMVPLRDEANMVDQLCVHLKQLDYPPEKLDVIFVVESRSPETIHAVERHLGDARFTLVVVPDATPRTKPKALDFALPFCRGEFVVVYDAEDRPDRDQLRSVVSQFRSEGDIECIQARLIIDNAHEGFLPTMFAGEYAGLFATLLPALARWGAVMPLGGTSNHFRLQTLRQLGGWDAYNVTEDADLGVRLARRGLRTATNDTRTLEDAPLHLKTWIGQRTRWMKGWMQTMVVHNRRPARLLQDLGLVKFVLFEFTIIGMLLAPLLHIGMWPMVIWMYVASGGTLQEPSAWGAACIAALVLGHGAPILLNIQGLSRSGQKRLWLYQLALPLYWLLVAFATILALVEFVRSPFHWRKTPHEVTKTKPVKPGAAFAAPAI